MTAAAKTIVAAKLTTVDQILLAILRQLKKRKKLLAMMKQAGVEALLVTEGDVGLVAATTSVVVETEALAAEVGLTEAAEVVTKLILLVVMAKIAGVVVAAVVATEVDIMVMVVAVAATEVDIMVMVAAVMVMVAAVAAVAATEVDIMVMVVTSNRVVLVEEDAVVDAVVNAVVNAVALIAYSQLLKPVSEPVLEQRVSWIERHYLLQGEF